VLHTDGPKGVQVGETACYSDEDDEGSFVGESNFMEADFPVPASRVIICSGGTRAGSAGCSHQPLWL